MSAEPMTGAGSALRPSVVVVNNVLGRAALARLLSDDFDVLDTAGTPEQMVETAARRRPDVVVIEGRLPPTRTDEHLRAAMAVRAQLPQVGVLILGRRVDLSAAAQLLAAGSDRVGWLQRDRVESVDQVRETIRTIAAGGAVLDPSMVSALLARRVDPTGLDRLTPREREVLAAMADGATNAAIARRMVVSQRAVEKHVANVFDKLDIPATDDGHRRVLAVLRFLS